ncbi:MAG: DnaJ C-terminal domain-containing protein [Deltaproteobacteria bacterium]
MMGKRDPYLVLGVKRAASAGEIKRAFRRLARLYHPDVNRNSKVSEARFREVAEAYEILGHEDKRRQYDMFGHSGVDADVHRAGHGSPFGGFSRFRTGFGFGGFSNSTGFYDIHEAFADFFRSGGRDRSAWSGARRGRDIETNLIVEFSDALQGVSANVRVLHRRIEVYVPPGVDTGTRMRVPGQGGLGFRGGSPGDLYLNITVRPHRLFRREGNDIYLDVSVTVREAIMGATIEIPGPDGRLALNIPLGTQSGTTFRFRRLGFPSLKGVSRGDFYVKTRIVIPEHIDTISRDLLAEFDERNPMDPRRGL